MSWEPREELTLYDTQIWDVGKDLHQDQLAVQVRAMTGSQCAWYCVFILGHKAVSGVGHKPSPSVLHFPGWDLVSFAAFDC